MGCSQSLTIENNEEKHTLDKNINEVVISKKNEVKANEKDLNQKPYKINNSKNILFLEKEAKKSENKLYSKKPEVKEYENTQHSNQEIKKGENILLPKKEEIKKDKTQSLPLPIEETENKSISNKEEIKEGENSLFLKNEEIEKKPVLKKEEIKEGENKGSSILEEKKDDELQLNSNNKIIIDKSKPKSSLSNGNESGNINFFKFSKIDMFIDEEDNPLEKYDYFKIDFTICNYIFITPEPLIELFSSFYSKILKDSTIFFPKIFNKQ